MIVSSTINISLISRIIQHLVTYPISQGRIINVGIGITLPGTEGTIYEGSWTSPATKDDVVQGFTGWEPEVQEIIKVSADPYSPDPPLHELICIQYVDGGLKWAINVVTKLPTFVDGRVALVGDAVTINAICAQSDILADHYDAL